MFTDELKNLLIQVISSWQVLMVTGVLVVYVFLVSYVAKLYHRTKPRPLAGKKKAKKGEAAVPAGTAEPSADDDLGLEEKGE
jgi:hypothetical protein